MRVVVAAARAGRFCRHVGALRRGGAGGSGEALPGLVPPRVCRESPGPFFEGRVFAALEAVKSMLWDYLILHAFSLFAGQVRDVFAVLPLLFWLSYLA